MCHHHHHHHHHHRHATPMSDCVPPGGWSSATHHGDGSGFRSQTILVSNLGSNGDQISDLGQVIYLSFNSLICKWE